MKYVCSICGWEYDESVGYPEGGDRIRHTLERGPGGFRMPPLRRWQGLL